MNEISVIVPKELVHPLFFKENETVILSKDTFSQFDWERVFIYEVAYFCGINTIKPWEMREQTIPILLKECAVIREQLETIFQKRKNKLALPLMKQGIGLFVEMFHWVNQVPVKLNPSIQYEKLPIQPINVKERLEFLFMRPNAYHSFVQLFELVEEMEKLYQKSLTMEKLHKQKN